MAVMIDFDPTAWTTGPLALYATNRGKIRWVLQKGLGTRTLIDCNVWWRDNYPQPPNGVSIVVKGDGPTWFDTVAEFNSLDYYEVRAQLANAMDRKILRVRCPAGTEVSADAVRLGAIPAGDNRTGLLDVSITT